ncbi:hypothetical protein C8R47DRAFT_1129207 [Mycena vitilis]|nr:hypothetical protein C8R47DRAFT_1129207 [Mycena vitilis]
MYTLKLWYKAVAHHEPSRTHLTAAFAAFLAELRDRNHVMSSEYRIRSPAYLISPGKPLTTPTPSFDFFDESDALHFLACFSSALTAGSLGINPGNPLQGPDKPHHAHGARTLNSGPRLTRYCTVLTIMLPFIHFLLFRVPLLTPGHPILVYPSYSSIIKQRTDADGIS